MKEIILNILQSTLPNVQKMEELINKDVHEALKLIEQPCGRFILSKNMVDNYIETANVSKEQIKMMISKMPVAGWVTGNPFYNLLSIYLITFLADQNVNAAISTSRFYAAVTCGYLKAKYFPICDADVLRYTLTQMHGASVVKEGFSKLCMKVADQTLNKYIEPMVQTLHENVFYRYLVDIRNKLNQSMKIIAWKYYDVQENKKQTNYEDIAEKINKNIINIASADNVINFVSKEIGISSIEIENLYISIIDHVDATLSMQMVVLKLLMTYNGIENIGRVGPRNIVNRAYRTEDIVKTVQDVFTIINANFSLENIKAILYLAAIQIISFR